MRATLLLIGLLCLLGCRGSTPDPVDSDLEDRAVSLKQAVDRQATARLEFETHALKRKVTVRCAHHLLPLARRMRAVISEIDTEIQRQLGGELDRSASDIYLAAFDRPEEAPVRGRLSGLERGRFELLLPVASTGEKWLAENPAVADGVLAGLSYAWTRRTMAARVTGKDRRWVVEGVSLFVAWRVARQVDDATARRMAAYWTPAVSLDRPRVRQTLMWWDGPIAAPVRLLPRERAGRDHASSESLRAREGAALQLIRRLVAVRGDMALVRYLRELHRRARPGDPTRLYQQLTGQSIHQVGRRGLSADTSALITAIEQLSRRDPAGKRHGLAVVEHLARKYSVASAPTYPKGSDIARYLTLAGTQAIERLGDAAPRVRIAAARALAALGREELDEYLVEKKGWLQTVAPESMLFILSSLGAAKGPERKRARWLLYDLLSHQRVEVRREAIGALRRATGRAFGYAPEEDSVLRKEAMARWRAYLDQVDRGES